jgi:hypothetical protein
MSFLNKDIGRFPLGVWFAIVALFTLLVGLSGQAYSLLDWDGAVDLGLQNDRFTGDDVERTWAEESRGVARADVVWLLPVWIVAFIGVMRKRFYGFAAGLMELSIGVYFPLVFAFQRWEDYPGTVIAAIFLFAIPSLLGIIGLWANRKYFEE